MKLIKEGRTAYQPQKTMKQTWNYNRLANVALQFTILFLLWLILSGHYGLHYILLGVVSAGLVTFLTNDLFYSLFGKSERKEFKARLTMIQIWHFISYLPWLLSRIVKANIQVAYIVLHPRMPIEPALLLFRTHLRRNFAQVILANSITLTPGTVTVDLEDRRYIIHVLVPPAARELLEAKMQNKVGDIFMEKEEHPPEARWIYFLEELEE